MGESADSCCSRYACMCSWSECEQESPRAAPPQSHGPRREDPFLPQNKIPLPAPSLQGIAASSLDTTAHGEACNVRRRNERERQRVRSVNHGFEKLRSSLPSDRFHEIARQRRLSKVDVLRAATQYIRLLQLQLLHD